MSAVSAEDAPSIELYWFAELVQFSLIRQTTLLKGGADAHARMGRAPCLAARPDEPHAAAPPDLPASALLRAVGPAGTRDQAALDAGHGVAAGRGACVGR